MTEKTEQRIDYRKIAREALPAMGALERDAHELKIEKSLVERVKMRASMMNGCAYCVHRHSKDARDGGESEQRLYALSGWREAPFFTPRERAAQEWTQAVTEVRAGHVPDDVYRLTREHLSEREIVDPDDDSHRDQCLEPARDFIPGRCGRLSTSEAAYGRIAGGVSCFS